MKSIQIKQKMTRAAEAVLVGFFIIAARAGCTLVVRRFSLTEIPFGGLLCLAGITIVTLAPPLFYYRKKYPVRETARGGNRFPIMAAGLIGCLAANLLIGLAAGAASLTVPEPSVRYTDFIGMAASVLILGILPAVLEELVFRRYMVTSLRLYGDRAAVIIAAAVFGMVHAGVVSGLLAFVCGLILGAVYLCTGQLRSAAAVHLLYNIIVLLTA